MQRRAVSRFYCPLPTIRSSSHAPARFPACRAHPDLAVCLSVFRHQLHGLGAAGSAGQCHCRSVETQRRPARPDDCCAATGRGTSAIGTRRVDRLSRRSPHGYSGAGDDDCPLLLGWLWANTFGEVLCVGLLLGVAGASFAVALPLASRWYPPRYQGLAMGIAGAGNSGTALATFFAPRLAVSLGWHAVFGLALIPVLITLVLFSLFAWDSPTQPAPGPLRDYAACCGSAIHGGSACFTQ